ncbi:unnamed protein product, partial [Brassica napus]
MNQTESSANENNPKPAITGETSAVPEWITETIKGGSLRHVDLHTGINGWASPPGDLWNLSSSLSPPPTTSQTNRNLPAETTSSLLPALFNTALTGSNPVKNSTTSLLVPTTAVAHSLRQAQARGESRNSFIFAMNFQVSGKEHYNLVFYFATEEPIPSDSVLKRFVDGDESY